MFDILVKSLLLLTILIQLVLSSYMLYNIRKQYKRDKKFYEELDEINQKILDDLRTQPAIRLDNVEGDVESEQKENSNNE